MQFQFKEILPVDFPRDRPGLVSCGGSMSVLLPRAFASSLLVHALKILPLPWVEDGISVFLVISGRDHVSPLHKCSLCLRSFTGSFQGRVKGG